MQRTVGCQSTDHRPVCVGVSGNLLHRPEGVESPGLLFVGHDFFFLTAQVLRMCAVSWRRIHLAPYYAELFEVDVRPQVVCVKAV